MFLLRSVEEVTFFIKIKECYRYLENYDFLFRFNRKIFYFAQYWHFWFHTWNSTAKYLIDILFYFFQNQFQYSWTEEEEPEKNKKQKEGNGAQSKRKRELGTRRQGER